jgi:hypothetical protein
LAELAPDPIRLICRRVLNPANDADLTVPALSILPSRWQREDREWTCVVGLQIISRSREDVADQTVLELCARVDDKVCELIDAGTAGGLIDQPVWDGWYSRANGLALIGAAGSLRIRVNDPILIG